MSARTSGLGAREREGGGAGGVLHCLGLAGKLGWLEGVVGGGVRIGGGGVRVAIDGVGVGTGGVGGGIDVVGVKVVEVIVMWWWRW